MNDILDMDGWTVLSTRLDGAEYELECEYLPQPTACQKCGVIGRLYRHGTKDVIYRDSPIRGRTVRLAAKVCRFKCRDCGGTFMQPLGGIHEERRMTMRCAEFIGGQALVDTFSRIALNVGCDEKTARALAGERMAAFAQEHRPELPVWLGVDETQIDGSMRLVLTDVVGRRPIDMLPNRDKGTFTTWLNHYRDRSHVKGVAIDMWRPYRDVAKAMLPGVPVVVDKFHVVRTASYCMERVRIRLQKTRKAGVRRDWLQSKALLNMRYAKLNEKQRFNVDMWLDNEPELAKAHRLKETFYGLYDLSRPEAEVVYDNFPKTVPPELAADFKVLLTSMKNWRTEILAFFDHPITNAYTEALNGVAKTINRQGRGYSFEVLRARLLYAKGIPQPLPPAALVVPDLGKLPATRMITAMERKRVLDQSGNRCMSCSGVFPSNELDIHQTLAFVPGEHRKLMVVCKTCHDRFHMKEVNRHYRPSTA
jgi:transposase